MKTIAIILDERTFIRWLACFTNPYSDGGDCGDFNGVFYDCYMYSNCDGVVDRYWHGCYWFGEDCDRDASTGVIIEEDPEPDNEEVEEEESPIDDGTDETPEEGIDDVEVS